MSKSQPKPCDGCGLGFCDRHAMYKAEAEAELCALDHELRGFLDRTAETRRSQLVGTKLAVTLQKLGVTKDRWAAVKAVVGASPQCDCDEREKWLNKVHAVVAEKFRP